MDALTIRKADRRRVRLGRTDGRRRRGAVAATGVKALVSVSGYLVVNLAANREPLPPQAEYGWWYQYYFATDRGETGLPAEHQRLQQAHLEATPPRVELRRRHLRPQRRGVRPTPTTSTIVIHNYRWRLQPRARVSTATTTSSARLPAKPAISVPTITIASDFDGPAKDGMAYRKLFTGRYEHRVLDGIGHNVPQEAPEAFAKAVLDISSAG